MRLLSVIASLAVLAGCPDDDCEKTCKRVAFCKEEASKSPEQVLGEKAPPPNKRCMERCRSDSEAFQNCEAQRRTCAALTDCLGSSFDN